MRWPVIIDGRSRSVVFGAAMFVIAGVLALADRHWLVAQRSIAIDPTAVHVAGLLVSGFLWIYFSVFMLVARKRQRERGAVFDTSLRGDLDRAIAQTLDDSRLAKRLFWRALVPLWIAAAITIVVLFHLKAAPAWVYSAGGTVMIVALILEIVRKQASVKNRLQLRLRELETLRVKLADASR